MKALIANFAFALIFAITVQAQITSSFDTDSDGWTILNGAGGDPVYVSTGGNPGGFLRATDAVGGVPTMMIAPAKYLGNKIFSYGLYLRFDLKVISGGAPNTNTNGDVRIYGGGTSLFANLSGIPNTSTWTTFEMRLHESQPWRVGSYSGSFATSEQVKQVLTALTAVQINVEYNSLFVGDVGAIDNVVLEQRLLLPAPVITSFSPQSADPGTLLTINGDNFDALVDNNDVFFGGLKAVITGVSVNELTVIVPAGAQYAPITVINKTTGLQKLSANKFAPTFKDGGRIIPASLSPKIEYSLPASGLGGLGMADIDGDGWVDMVVASSNNTEVTIYRNLGTGGIITNAVFDSPVSFSTGGSSTNGAGLCITDLNGDGKLDLSTSIGRSAFVGSFASLKNISTPGNLAFEPVEYWNGRTDESPVYAVADIDGDGRPELIGGEGAGGVGQNVWILQNISTPDNIEFGYSLFYFSSALDDAASGATIDDLDNDGKPEFILKSSFDGRLTVFSNTSTPGSISFGTSFAILEGISGGIVTADFNLDGKNDLAWKQSNTVHIRLNTNSGGPLNMMDFDTKFILNSELRNYGALSIGDINGDGKPDLLASDNSQIGIFENVFESGIFTSEAFVRAYVFEGTGNSTYLSTIVPSDINGDGKPELIVGVTNVTPRKVLIYENRNAVAPSISINTVSPLEGVAGSIITISGDNFSQVSNENDVYFGTLKAEVLTASQTVLTVRVPAGVSMDYVKVYRNNLSAKYHLPFIPIFGPGVIFDNSHFAPPISFLLTSAGYELEVCDFNLDGKPDILASGLSSRGYSFSNKHNGGPISDLSILPSDTTSSSITKLRLSDIDADGLVDIYGTNGAYRNKSLNNSIDFDVLTNFSLGSNQSSADFNKDGKPDLIGVNGNMVSIVENWSRPGTFVTGNYPTLSPSINFPKPATGGYTEVADLDGDGKIDFVTTNPGTDNVSVWKNEGGYRNSTAQFTPLIDIPVGDNPGKIYSGDLDVDGKVDLVLHYPLPTTSQFITVLHNVSSVGNIQFTRVDYPLGALVTLIHLSDLDGEGRPEILISSEQTNQLLILRNNSSPGILDAVSFDAPFSIPVTSPKGLTTGDINMDGKQDIVICSNPNSLLIFENLIEGGAPNQPPIIDSVPLITSIGGKIEFDLTTIISDLNDNIDFASIRIVIPSASGALASINGAFLVIDYTSANFSGSDQITIEVCDLLNSCTQQVLSINVVGDVVIYNAISANNDGLNDIFRIQYVDIIQEASDNEVYIYNRWGDVVFHVMNYDNSSKVFSGLSDKGEELPSGTYFYKLTFSSGKSGKSGYLTLLR